METPKVNKDELEASYMQRCMSHASGYEMENDEKVTMCLTAFRGSPKPSYSMSEKIDFSICSIRYLEGIELGFEEELTEANFYIPEASEYEDFGEKTEEVSVSSLWENIRKKRDRLGKKYKPAKPGDKDVLIQTLGKEHKLEKVKWLKIKLKKCINSLCKLLLRWK